MIFPLLVLLVVSHSFTLISSFFVRKPLSVGFYIFFIYFFDCVLVSSLSSPVARIVRKQTCSIANIIKALLTTLQTHSFFSCTFTCALSPIYTTISTFFHHSQFLFLLTHNLRRLYALFLLRLSLSLC